MKRVITLEARLVFTLLTGNLFYNSMTDFDLAYESVCWVWDNSLKDTLPKPLVKLALLQHHPRLNELSLYEPVITPNNWDDFYRVFVSIYGRKFVIEV